MGTKNANPVQKEVNKVAKRNVNTTSPKLKGTPKKVETTKKLSILFYQGPTQFETTFVIDSEKNNDSYISGTAINELFTLQSNYKKAGLRLFKSNEPILFKVSEEENELLNIGLCSRIIKEKLKFQNNAKSMRTFAKRVNLAITEMNRTVKVVNYKDIEKAIDSITE
jgi:hypothetical protein